MVAEMKQPFENGTTTDDSLAKETFQRWYQSYAPLVLSFLRSRVRPSAIADDLAQHVWMKVWTHIDRFDGENPRAWILTIARNQLLDHTRSRHSIQTPADFDAPDHRGWLADEELEQRTLALRNCLETISAELSIVVEFRLLGKDYSAIAGELDIPLGTAHSRFSKAKEQLKRCVEGQLP